jgi:hypothetical protein
MIPAIERFDGVYFRTIRKYIREGRMKNTDVLILSEKDGLVRSDQKLPYRKPAGKIGVLTLGPTEVESARLKNLEMLTGILNDYSEIFINVGRQYLKLIDGFEEYTKAKVTYAKGRFGEKAAHMRDWISSG